MERYQRVEKARSEAPVDDKEIRVTTQGRMRNYITYAITLFQEKGSDEISLKAMGRAINKTVMIAELIKRRVAGLHEITSIDSTDITDMWEPLEEGLLPLETTRHVSVITIILSKKELDSSSVGYQPPIPADLVKPLVEHEYGDGPPNIRGRGRGRSRGRGNYYNGEIEYDREGGWEGGRGRSRGGYGEFNGYDYGGRGRGGWSGKSGSRGRGSGGGRGLRSDAPPVQVFA